MLDRVLEDLQVLESVVAADVLGEGLRANVLHAAPRDAQFLQFCLFVGLERLRDCCGCLGSQSRVCYTEHGQVRRRPQELLELVDSDRAEGIVVHVKLLDRLRCQRVYQHLDGCGQRGFRPRHKHVAEVGVPELLACLFTDELGDVLAGCGVVRVPVAFNCVETIRVDPLDVLANELLKLLPAVEKLLLRTNLELLVIQYFMVRVTRA